MVEKDTPARPDDENGLACHQVEEGTRGMPTSLI
jgi:hypothetical protein